MSHGLASASPSIGGIAAPDPVAMTTALRAAEGVVADLHAPLAVQCPMPAEQLDAPLLQPGKLHRVVEVVDHLVAAGERRFGVQPPRDRLRGAGNSSHLG